MRKLSFNIIRTDTNPSFFEDFQSAIVPLMSKYPSYIDVIFDIVGITKKEYQRMEITRDHLRSALHLYFKDRSDKREYFEDYA
jgi:hypothetical protein